MRFSASPFTGLPVVVKNLLIINVIVFLVKTTGLGDFMGRDMDSWFGLHFFTSPLFEPWQLVTHMFMHGGFGHVALNMLGLFMLAPPLEYRWGSKRFLTFYMVTGVGASLFYSGVHAIEYSQLIAVMSPENIAQVMAEGHLALADYQNFVDADMAQLNSLLNIPMVGASGALYGVLLAFGMMFPNVELIMFPLPIPIKARYFVMLYAAISVYNAIASNPDDNVAHLAHLGGMLVGFILVKVWKHQGTSAF